MTLPFFLPSIAFSHSQRTFVHDLLSPVLISFTATLCLSLPSVNQFSPVPAYSDSFCLSCSTHPFLLNLSPSWDACPVFPNVPSLLHFPALSGQQACPQTKFISSHMLGKPHHSGSDSSSGTRRGCCAAKPWLCPCQHSAAAPRNELPWVRNRGATPAVTPFTIIKEVKCSGSLKNWLHLHEKKPKLGHIYTVHSTL